MWEILPAHNCRMQTADILEISHLCIDITYSIANVEKCLKAPSLLDLPTLAAYIFVSSQLEIGNNLTHAARQRNE